MKKHLDTLKLNVEKAGTAVKKANAKLDVAESSGEFTEKELNKLKGSVKRAQTCLDRAEKKYQEAKDHEGEEKPKAGWFTTSKKWAGTGLFVTGIIVTGIFWILSKGEVEIPVPDKV